ncbi:Hermansky-Pudlak syndrome 6 protein-like [Megalops cyprinoides]|uniref:Hermansky-Pudlak syndrome 6 protein-like n=1 Tax=Megalops cyprinoides TaxID=118141 RepID=UPI001864170C|nr:Hermansky-Pudlak syndrome 6 protein-like [Megalops cyprinoides]
MKQLVLEQVTDFCDFTRGKDFADFLKEFSLSSCYNGNTKSCLSDVRISPDGHHIHVIFHKPKIGLLTFDKYERPALIQTQKHQDLCLTRTVPIVDIIYLAHGRNADRGAAVLVVIFENGKAEFWRYWERKAGWHLLHTSDLCNSFRARVVSVCSSGNFIVWCEERPPSENSPAPGATRSNFRYCICKRTYEVDEANVRLGGVMIALHNSPRYTVTASGDNVYLLPDPKANSLRSISKFFFKWTPQRDTVTICSACKGALLKKSPAAIAGKESDFNKLVSDCVGTLAALDPPEIWACCPTGSGGLVLLLSSGWVSFLQSDGVLRRVYKLADNCLTAAAGGHSSMNLYQEVLALTVGRTLFVIDAQCGLELGKVALRREGILFVNSRKRNVPHFLSEAGLFLVKRRELDPSHKLPGHPESVTPDSVLAEAVFEEACRHYQRRSLSGAQLTVEKLKSGRMFQAPISLASILSEYLRGHRAADLLQGGGGSAHPKLLSSLEPELKAMVALEEVKAAAVRSSEKELLILCEKLVLDEVGRVLSSEPDVDSILYLNTVFGTFPTESWQALQVVLGLGVDGEGFLHSQAPAEVWKAVLAPVQPAAAGCDPQRCPPANTAVPAFELLCQSLFRFQSGWLPRFLEMAQQHQASASSCSSSSCASPSPWSYGVQESEESLPLYKRALSVLPANGEHRDLEVELLLSSQRPRGVMQALRILIGQQQWGRVTQVAERFCRRGPVFNREIFTALLCEVAQHRHLDPYLDVLWSLCPEDLTVNSILNIVLKSLPPTPPEQSPGPFPDRSSQLTVGLLKPLLSKVLQRETKPSHRYAEILTCPPFSIPAPPSQVEGLPRPGTEQGLGNHQDSKQKALLGNRKPITSFCL